MDENDQISEFDKLRIIYQDIIRGYSYSQSENLYIKHLTESDNAAIVHSRITSFLKYKKDGLPSIKDKLKQLDDDKIWTKSNEEEIEQLRIIISDNEKNIKTLIPEQQSAIKKIIEQHEVELAKLLSEKYSLLGKTADEQAETDSFDTLIFLTFFKNPQLTEHFFESVKQVGDEEEITKYKEILNQSYNALKEDNIRKISVLSFFIGPFTFAKENLVDFFGKPICDLTTFQIHLSSLGSRNINILTEAGGSQPEILPNTSVDEILEWYDRQHSINIGKRQTGRSGITKTVKEVAK